RRRAAGSQVTYRSRSADVFADPVGVFGVVDGVSDESTRVTFPVQVDAVAKGMVFEAHGEAGALRFPDDPREYVVPGFVVFAQSEDPDAPVARRLRRRPRLVVAATGIVSHQPELLDQHFDQGRTFASIGSRARSSTSPSRIDSYSVIRSSSSVILRPPRPRLSLRPADRRTCWP